MCCFYEHSDSVEVGSDPERVDIALVLLALHLILTLDLHVLCSFCFRCPPYVFDPRGANLSWSGFT